MKTKSVRMGIKDGCGKYIYGDEIIETENIIRKEIKIFGNDEEFGKLTIVKVNTKSLDYYFNVRIQYKESLEIFNIIGNKGIIKLIKKLNEIRKI